MSAAIRVVVDPPDLDLDRVHRWLSEHSYWARGRPREVTERAIGASTNLAAYDGPELIGYARLLTDHATFAWLCDVFVDPAYRDRGVGTALLDAVDGLLGARRIRRALLATADAHSLYAAHGFTPLPAPERWMIRSYLPTDDPQHPDRSG